MKRVLMIVLAVLPITAVAQPLKLESLDKLAAKATESVTVKLDGSMLRLASRFLSNEDADQAQVKKLVAGLRGIYVRHFEFAKAGQYLESDVEAIRNQLSDAKWKRIVEVRGHDNADVCLRQEGDNVTGLAVIAAEPLELTAIYIDGPIDVDSLVKLEGNFGIPEGLHRHIEKKSK